MILRDTHVWVWWVHGNPRLPEDQREMLDARVDEGIGVSIIACWEVAKLVERGRLSFPQDVAEWPGIGLAYPGVRLVQLTPAISSNRLACRSRSIRTRRTRFSSPPPAFMIACSQPLTTRS